MSTKQPLVVSPEDLTLVEENSLNGNQLKHLLKKTPDKYIRQRPAKGGGVWSYVSGGYVKKVLNLMFGWDWDFEILDEKIMHGEVVVKGKLTCRTNGHTIVKTQFGNKDIICKKGTDIPLSIGNDLKAAATDALKKCAAEIGIAADIYNKEEFNETIVDTSVVTLESLTELYEIKLDNIPHDELPHIERIIREKESKSFKKVFNYLSKL